MAAYRRVYDSRYLQADCQEPGSAPEPYAQQWSIWATFVVDRVSRRSTAIGRVRLFLLYL